MSEQLTAWAERHRLRERAVEGCREHLVNVERADIEAGNTPLGRRALHAIRQDLASYALVIDPRWPTHPTFEVHLQLWVEDDAWQDGRRPVGRYRYVVSGAGEMIDDFLTFE